ncbi:hypothetical protein C7T94_08345 [Pedobacter yulinensis]|uniref:Grasp-with-spasm system SPASM domain peptide maturase n=1 Tax=Pedobacter yulinensis TaxID=2126353 RepID=A0A2T3HJV4_9SPHI|nr:hypothetical protein [Pedobacter yulinensis]PST82661.1 hypothetical protein C7T94_08345 [Pedobacter yulinensis]
MSKFYLRNQLCIPVDGYNRAMIYDLGRRDYHFISRAYYGLLNTDGFINFDQIADQSERSELIDFLLDLEIIFEVAAQHEEKRFPPVTRSIAYPNQLTHAVIHANISPAFIDVIGNSHLQNLSILAPQISDELLKLIASIKHLEIDGIYLYIENFEAENIERHLTELGRHFALFSVNFFGAATPDTQLRDNIYYNFFTESLQDYCQKTTVDKLFVNHDLFFEAYNKHAYYHGKVYIDQSGQIKNGLNNTQSFGNINSVTAVEFQQIVHSEPFMELGNINKNETLVCKDCEFRYMCTDPRVPVKGDAHWYHPTECQYNPYLSLWQHDDGYLDLQASGVTVSATGCTIDKALLDMKFNQIWSE